MDLKVCDCLPHNFLITKLLPGDVLNMHAKKCWITHKMEIRQNFESLQFLESGD